MYRGIPGVFIKIEIGPDYNFLCREKIIFFFLISFKYRQLWSCDITSIFNYLNEVYKCFVNNVFRYNSVFYKYIITNLLLLCIQYV